MNVCPECGKRHVVHWPEFWPYRRDKTFYCSQDCEIVSVTRDLTLIKDVARARRKRKLKKDYTDIAREMIRIKESGGGNREIFEYLESIGYENPEGAYYYIRKSLKKSDPELEAKIGNSKPGPAKKEATEAEPEIKLAAEEIAAEGMIPVMTASGPIAVKPILKPVVYDGLTVREVEGLFGRYRRTDTPTIYIDFEMPDSMDVISNTPGQWRAFFDELRKAAQVLGVEL
jgi:hypothetical protein